MTTTLQNEHAILFEIKPHRLQKWKKWCKLLGTTYRHEVLKSLEEERGEKEMFLSFELGGKTYGLAYMAGESGHPSQAREVNRIHSDKVNECLKPVSKVNILYSAKADPKAVYADCEW